MTEKHIDEATGVSTTGHEWDGIKELNNPLSALVALDLLRHHPVGDRLHHRLSGLAASSRPRPRASSAIRAAPTPQERAGCRRGGQVRST